MDFNKRIKSTPIGETKRILVFFELLNLVASTISEFDPRDHLRENDPNYKWLMSFFDVHESEFDYQSFLKEGMALLGDRYKLVLSGYEALVDKFCSPNAEFLEPKPALAFLEDGSIALKAVFVGQSENLKEWRMNKSEWGLKYSFKEKMIDIDNQGFCTNGYDLMNIGNEDLFPVKSYILTRNPEAPLDSKSLSNQ